MMLLYKQARRGLPVALLATMLAVSSGCTPKPPVQIVSAVAPATPPGVDVAAVYVEIIAAADDVLLEIATPLADRTEIHETGESGGMMQMRPIASVVLKAGKPVRFAPGGMHLMLMNLHKPLLVDHSFPLDLHLQNAGIVTAEVHVVPPGAIATPRR